MTVEALLADAGLLLTTTVGSYLLKRRSLWMRLCFELACLGLLTLTLMANSASPFLFSKAAFTDGLAAVPRLLAICWWLVAARILSSIISAILGHDERSREARLGSDLLAAAVYLVAAVCIINFVLGLPIQGVLATSGVVAIVIGLALQSTLSDVFSGIAVGVEAPFSVGDRISLGTAIEGVVVQINWRSTRVKTDGDDVAIIPNSLVARSEIVNRSVPTERRTAQVFIQCGAAIAPSLILELLEHAILLSPTLISTPPAYASLSRLGQTRNMYSINLSVKHSTELDGAKSQLLQSARRQLDHAGVLLGLAREPASRSHLLQQTGLFDALDDEQQEALLAKCECRRLRQGDALFTQGELDPTLYVVCGGVLEITKSELGGAATTFGRIGAGEYIGEVCFLTGAPHSATATALSRCEVLCVGYEALAPLMHANPEIVPSFEHAVSEALDQMQRGAAAEIGRQAAGNEPLLERIYSYFRRSAG